MADKKQADNLRFVPVAQVRHGTVALREVNKTSEEYQGLLDSVRQVGVLNAVTVREMRDNESGQKFFSLIDGLHRLTAAQDAGLEDIPCHILTMDECAVLEAQLMLNIHKVETRPVEYSRQLGKILAHNTTMTATELSVKLGKSPGWVGQRLGLIKLDDKIQSLVDDGTINLSNAIAMSKLPVDEQGNFVERAMTMTPGEFTPTVNARAKELRDAKRQGRDPSASEFVAVPHLRKLGEIRNELEHVTIGPVMVREQGLKKPEDIWKAAISWVLTIDPHSVEAARAKHEARKAQGEAEKQQRIADRKAAKDAKAAAQAAVQSAVA
jgi:ParB/RepB/Spo0J family partition protein